MRPVTLVLGICYVTSLVALRCVGMSPAVPWAFILGILVMFVPLAYLSTEILYLLKNPIARLGKLQNLAAVLVGILGLAAYALTPNTSSVVVVAALLSIIHLGTFHRELLGTLAWSVVALVFMFGAIWNFNQAVGPFTLNRLLDSEMISIELAIYEILYGVPVSAKGLFPWPSPHWLFTIIETAYFLLFCEVFVVIFVCARARVSPAGFFACSFAAYAIGLAIFCFFPIVGPVCTDPDMIAEAYHDTNTYYLTTQQAGSYADILARRPCRGFAYLVAFPSLHVAMAFIMQRFLAVSPVHFWALLPVNFAMSLATVYLGFHYLIDIAGGLLLAEGVLIGYAAWQKGWSLWLPRNVAVQPS